MAVINSVDHGGCGIVTSPNLCHESVGSTPAGLIGMETCVSISPHASQAAVVWSPND
jgi:hypothetical protein